MKITTKDIIKALPMEANIKATLLTEFNAMPLDNQIEVEQLLWQTYNALYQAKLQENIQLALLDAQEDKEKLDKEFYRRVREKTNRYMQEELANSSQDVDLAAARKAMEMIVGEIRASKSAKKSKH